MKFFIYIVIFLIVLIMAKAFYFDALLEKRASDANLSMKENQSSEPSVIENNRITKETEGKRKHEGMPVDELGDSIADKLEGKF